MVPPQHRVLHWLISIAALVASITAGCQLGAPTLRGTGVRATQTRKLEGFDELQLAGSGRVEITIGNSSEVTIEADDNLIDQLSTEVIDSRLVISPKVPLHSQLGLIFKITTPHLTSMSVSGSATI